MSTNCVFTPLKQGPGVFDQNKVLETALHKKIRPSTKKPYYQGAIDGRFGPVLASSVRAYQTDEGLEIDDVAGPETCGSLGIWCKQPKSSQNVGYFIDPENTPLNLINWAALKAKGITEVYVRVMNADYNTFGSVLAAIQKAGLKAYAWIWEGFTYTSFLTLQGWNILLDLETYNMPKYYSEIKGIQNLCKANKKTFIVCTHPEGPWDDDQNWDTIKDYCDYLMPMLYLHDYYKSLTDLQNFMKTYNQKYPGKIYPVLETYESDKNVVAKSNSEIMAEVNAVKPYCKGFGLFRYGISNY